MVLNQLQIKKPKKEIWKVTWKACFRFLHLKQRSRKRRSWGRGRPEKKGEKEEEERDKKREEEDGERLFKHSSPNFLPPGERRHVI